MTVATKNASDGPSRPSLQRQRPCIRANEHQDEFPHLGGSSKNASVSLIHRMCALFFALEVGRGLASFSSRSFNLGLLVKDPRFTVSKFMVEDVYFVSSQTRFLVDCNKDPGMVVYLGNLQYFSPRHLVCDFTSLT